jgi:DNA polymerase V
LPSQDSAQLVQAAHRCLERIFKPDVNYQRAGVLLPELMPARIVQSSFFDSEKCSMASEQLMTALDNINHIYGREAVFYGSEMISNRWRMRQQYNSSSYTTNWNELLTVHI